MPQFIYTNKYKYLIIKQIKMLTKVNGFVWLSVSIKLTLRYQSKQGKFKKL